MLTFEIFSLDDNYLDWMITTSSIPMKPYIKGQYWMKLYCCCSTPPGAATDPFLSLQLLIVDGVW